MICGHGIAGEWALASLENVPILDVELVKSRTELADAQRPPLKLCNAELPLGPFRGPRLYSQIGRAHV